MNKFFREFVIILSVFFIAFAARKAIPKEIYQLYGCHGDSSASKSSKLIDCSSVEQIVTTLRKQMDFTIESRLGWEAEIACRMPYAYAVRASVEDRISLKKKAPELLAQCNKGLTSLRKQ